MLKKQDTSKRDQVTFISFDQLVPEDHLVRKIDAAIDFSFIYKHVEDLYCQDNGRPSIDPVQLFKIAFV